MDGLNSSNFSFVSRSQSTTSMDVDEPSNDYKTDEVCGPVGGAASVHSGKEHMSVQT